MFNWIKKQWEKRKIQKYLESITIKDAKPCPFCGEKIIRLHEHGIDIQLYHLKCTTCGARLISLPSKESAKKYWNQRVGEKQ